LGASEVLFGGQTMNPSTQELLAAIRRVETDQVLILPNNSNIILAAQQAQALAGKQARLVATRTVPQGIAAVLSFNYQADLETNARRMAEAAQKVDTIEITRSVRDTVFNGFCINTGDVIGLLNDNLVSVGQDYDEVTLNVLAGLGNGAGHLSQAGALGLDGSAREYELVTIYFGKDCPDRQARSLAHKISEVCPGVAVEVHQGGQPHYHYILSLE
jgi:dihydroxyacetone kinase-like predicted kinase